MMPSKALRSVSLAIASRSTAPTEYQEASISHKKAEKHCSCVKAAGWQGMEYSLFLTLISAIVEDVEGIYCLFASLLVTEDQINPLVEVTGHMLTFLQFKIKVLVI